MRTAIFLPNLSALRPPIKVPTIVILNPTLTNQLSSFCKGEITYLITFSEFCLDTKVTLS